jgi:sugar lactone lactonase YvrE
VQSTEQGWRVIGEARDRLGESVLWHADEKALYWVDFYEPGVRRLDPVTGDFQRWRLDVTATIGSLAFAAGGRLLVAIDGGVYLFDPSSGDLSRFADPNQGRPGIGYNDAKVDRDGRYWIGTFDIAEAAPRGMLYRVDGVGRAVVGDGGYVVCNGPAFSPAGDILYFSDTAGRRILAYDLDRVTGGLSVPRVFATFGEANGMPDGICTDSAGTLYCAHYGGGRVTVTEAGGRRRETWPLPVRNVTSCCLGGPDLATLYVTTAEDGGRHPLDGALFARRVDVPGIPEPLFAGP